MSYDPKVLKKLKADPLAFAKSLVIPSGSGVKRFGDCMADFQRERFEQIVPALLAVAKNEKPPIGRYWWEATKGASKDSDLAICILWLLACTKRPLACQIGAADQDQADEMRQIMKGILRQNSWLADRIKILSWKIVCEDTHSECVILAADVAGSHGARPDVLILNELSHVEKQEFAENLLDNAAKVPHGLAVIATNSGYTGTWQERWREIATSSPERWIANIFDRPSPWLDDAEIEEAKRRNSRARFLRLWHGVWASSAGDALDDEDIRAAVYPTLSRNPDRQNDWVYVAGLDLGIKQDHSGFVVLGGNRKTLQIRLVDAQRWAPDATTGKVDLMAVERSVLAAHRRYRLVNCLYDPWNAELMAQRLTLQNVPMEELRFTGQNLNLMATTLLDVFRSRRFEMFECPSMVADLHRLTIEEKSYGHRLSATRDENGHADLATALAIALPYTVEQVGTVPIVAGAVNDNWDDDSPYLRELKRLQGQNALDQYEREMFRNESLEPGDPVWRNFMKRVGRLNRS